MDEANKIISGEEFDEQLMNYLAGSLSGEALQAVKKQLDDDAFVKDAIEGLQRFSSNKKLDEYVRNLNQNLQQQLAAKKQKRWSRNLSHSSWIMLATVIILLLCVMAYVVIMFVKNH